ncbi:MAG: TIGR00730 family Rossman fold protein [Rhodospirillaceae bacterium]
MAADDDGFKKGYTPVKAYKNTRFLNSPGARVLRILSEYLEPDARFREFDIADTIVFFGSARIKPQDWAEAVLEKARADGGDTAAAERDLMMSRYYEAARELSRRLTEWSKSLDCEECRFIVCSGGGPGIMEAANRGASEAKGINIGLGISLPHEQFNNPHITRELSFEFHYFFMRKLWFVYLAKAIVVFPGGFGTLDEMFESLTLVQTGKIKKHMPIVLFGKDFWEGALNLDVLVDHGTVSPEDLKLLTVVDDVDTAYNLITEELEQSLADGFGPRL